MKEQTSDAFARVVGVSLAVLLITAAILFVNLVSNPTSHVHAQGAGTVGIQAQMIPVFSAQSTTTSSAIFNDIGQGQNSLFVCGTNFSGTIDLEWSPTKVAPFYSITQASYQSDSSCHVIQVSSYWPNMRSTITPTAGSASAWYTSSSGPVSFTSPAIGTNGPTSPIFCDRMQVTPTVANGATLPLAPQVNAGDRVFLCSITVSFSAATTAGTWSVVYYTSSACSSTNNTAMQQFTTASTPQTLTFPNVFISNWYNPALQVPCVINNSGSGMIVTSSYASVHLL
jgi:hypothetical protein